MYEKKTKSVRYGGYDLFISRFFFAKSQSLSNFAVKTIT